MNNTKLPTAAKLTILRQLCNYIPNHLVPQLARETGVAEQTRTFDGQEFGITGTCADQVNLAGGLRRAGH